MMIPDTNDTAIGHITILPLLSLATFSEAAIFPGKLES